MTTNKYEFDSVRWLRNVAEVQSHRVGAGPAMLRENMLKCAEEIAALRARVARLEEALKRGVELHENCDADTCMCGESMWHALSDHKPTATLQYYGDQWAEEARRALEEK